jgi:hypothetical protein
MGSHVLFTETNTYPVPSKDPKMSAVASSAVELA